MTRRPLDLPNDAMTKKQLDEFRNDLMKLSPFFVQDKYKNLADKCRFMELPTPRVIQELVATWKVLWGWRK